MWLPTPLIIHITWVLEVKDVFVFRVITPKNQAKPQTNMKSSEVYTPYRLCAHCIHSNFYNVTKCVQPSSQVYICIDNLNFDTQAISILSNLTCFTILLFFVMKQYGHCFFCIYHENVCKRQCSWSITSSIILNLFAFLLSHICIMCLLTAWPSWFLVRSKERNSPLCNFLQSPSISSLLGQNIYLRTTPVNF